MACGCCDLNRIKKLFEEKRKREASRSSESGRGRKKVLKEAEAKPIAKPRKKKVEVKEEKTPEEEELL